MCKIYKSKYKDAEAVALENELLILKFLPELGGKLASMVYKKTGREFFVQSKNEKYKVLKYDGSYVDAECSGFDDIFPTIDTCYYQSYPWEGIKVPDHGEVCGLPWQYEIKDDTLKMWVYGVRFPYKFEKYIKFKKDNTIGIEYNVENLSNFDIDFIWAAHSMINSEEGGEIILPFEKNEDVTCVFSTDEELSSYGGNLKWPDGNLNITKEKNENGDNYKVYFNNKLPNGWCAYKYPKDDVTLRCDFPIEKVPYFSMWVNEGPFHDLQNIAFEPCSGAFDRIDVSKLHNKNSVLKANSSYNWYFDISVV